MSRENDQDSTAKFLAEIERFLQASGLGPTAFGKMAVGDGTLVKRLNSGTSVTLSTVDRVRQFMTNYRHGHTDAA